MSLSEASPFLEMCQLQGLQACLVNTVPHTRMNFEENGTLKLGCHLLEGGERGQETTVVTPQEPLYFYLTYDQGVSRS